MTRLRQQFVENETISAGRKWEVLLAIFPEEQPRLTRGEAWGRFPDNSQTQIVVDKEDK